MSPLWMVVIGLWCSAVFALTGCNPAVARADPVSADVYLARFRTIGSGKITVPPVSNRIGGDVFIVTGRGDGISANVMATVSGGSLEAVRIAAGRRITVTNDGANVEVRLLPVDGGKDPDSNYRARLQVGVPPAADLPTITDTVGNIGVYGNVGVVKAVILDHGDIEVHGADGDVNLSTPKGSLTVDIMPHHKVTLHAVDGTIDLHATDALVSAATTNKDIRFYGTLRPGETHYFTTTAGGGIHLALPPYPNRDQYQVGVGQQVYRFYITTSASPVNVEYPARGAGQASAALPICGFIHSSGPYDYHVENTPAGTGRIEVPPVLTSTYFFSGTLATSYFRFDTDQTRVAFYTPLPQSIHIYTAAQLNEFNAHRESIAPDCQDALAADSPSAIVVNLKTERGPVYIRHMLGD